MAKLPKEYQFVDLSDYGRGAARFIAQSLRESRTTPIQVTTWFVISGLLAIVCMLIDFYIAAGFFLILKSILDAADGELSRIKKTPSYVGRYYDSIADILLNFLFLITICYITNGSILLTILAFIGIQLQGTLYNYYYVILRNLVHGDTTSRIFEDHAPQAMKGETQVKVDIYYKIYDILYVVFDKTIYNLDRNAMNSNPFPTLVYDDAIFIWIGFSATSDGSDACFETRRVYHTFFYIVLSLDLCFYWSAKGFSK
jgi:hypothetical protein